MTYSETQTPLFTPSYVNLVNAKDHWKIGESEHNTDCDVTNSHAPNICINPPMFCSRQPNHQKFCRCCEETNEDNSQMMEINVMFQAVQGVWNAGMGCVCIQKGTESK